MLGIVGIPGKERRMEWERQVVRAPQFGIGKDRFRVNAASSSTGKGEVENPKPVRANQVRSQEGKSNPSVADLAGRGWSYRVTHETKTHAIVEFTSPVDGNVKRTLTILRDMLPSQEGGAGHRGRPVLHLGKTDRDRKNGNLKQHEDNRRARAELNREHAHGGEGKR